MRSMCTSRSSARTTCCRIGPQRQVVAGHQHHRLDPVQRVARRVRVDRRERAVVARVHRLQHVERLGAANLADDDAVGPHAQGVADEVADRDFALALDVRRARLEPEHVPLVELQLGGVLDRDDPLVVRDRGRERVQQRRLARARAARDQDVQLRLDAAARKSTDSAESEPMLTMSSIERRRFGRTSGS